VTAISPITHFKVYMLLISSRQLVVHLWCLLCVDLCIFFEWKTKTWSIATYHFSCKTYIFVCLDSL